MKKTISALILSALLLVSLSACNKVEETPALGSSQSEQSAIENSTSSDESNKAKNPEKSEAESKPEQSESSVNKPSDGTLSELQTDNPSATESKAEEKKPTTSKPSESKPADEPSSSPTTPKPTESEEPADEPTSKPVEVSKPNHTHSYTSKVVAPTCTDNGYTLYTCSCGKSYKEDETKATGHTWVKGSTVKATCTDNGYTNYTCSVCGAKGTANETEATGHNWQKVKTVAPTCTKDGYTSYKCTNCGNTKKGKITEATGHSWSKWKTTKKATSTAEGKKERSCSVCGKTEGKNIAKINSDHNCWLNGWTVSKDVSHPKQVCDVCGASVDISKVKQNVINYCKKKGMTYCPNGRPELDDLTSPKNSAWHSPVFSGFYKTTKAYSEANYEAVDCLIRENIAMGNKPSDYDFNVYVEYVNFDGDGQGYDLYVLYG